MVGAMARHMDTSMPFHSPLLSAMENPGMPVDTPHWTKPFFLTLSKVAPALAAEDAANSAAATAANFSDRKSAVEGTSVPVRVDLGCRRIIKKKISIHTQQV